MRANHAVIIFDADGTLYTVKTAPADSRLYRFLAGKTGISERELRRRHALEISKVKRSKNPKVRTRLFPISKLVGDPKLAKAAELEFWRGLRIERRPGTAKLLSGLRRAGFGLALASDEFLPHLSDKMNSALGRGWKKYFDCVVTPDSAGTMKPSGRYYRLILKKLKVGPSDAIVVGNSWGKDLEPAAGMGLKTVLLGGGKMEGGPDFFIRKLSSLRRVVESSWAR